MALRPPLPRRQRSNPFNRNLPDEAIGLIAGFLIATMAARTIALAAGLEHWTTTWRVINALTIWAVWPIEFIGVGQTPTLVGQLRPIDVLLGVVVVILGLVMLAMRTFRRRAF